MGRFLYFALSNGVKLLALTHSPGNGVKLPYSYISSGNDVKRQKGYLIWKKI